MNFSVCLIAKNESKTLPRLLESLKEFQERGGKVLLLDTGSTDGTAEVARQAGCEVHEVGDKFVHVIDEDLAKKINDKFVVDDEEPVVKAGDRLFDYSAARNYIADFSPTDMIATPDCDEVYTMLNLDVIMDLISHGVDQFKYNFVFAHDAHGKPTIQFTHSKFYNRKKMKWVGIIHEVLSGDGNMVDVPESVIKLEHFQNHETDRSGYLRGLALDCYLNPDNDRNSHYFGRELYYKQRNKSAIKELMRHIAMNKWVTEKAQSMNYIGECMIRLGHDQNGLEWFFRSILTEPSRREPLIRLAEYFYLRKNYQQTAIFAAAALEIGPSSYYSNNAEHYGAYPHHLLYWAKWYLGDKAGSYKHFKKALELDPENPRYQQDKQFYVDME